MDCLPHDVCANLSTSKLSTLTFWHQRLGHTNEQRLKFAVNKQLMIGVDDVTNEVHLPFYEACVQSKQTRKPFRSLNDVQTKGKLQLIHSDVCGPISVPSLGGNKYFVTFTDDYSRFSYVYMLKNKSDVFEKFQELHAEVTNMFSKRIKTLRTDNGGEYMSAEIEAF